MHKKLISIVMATILFLGLSGVSFADTPAKGSENNVIVKVNGYTLTTDVPAVIKDGRTLVPLAAVSKSFGADVKWDGATQTVTVTSGNLSLKLKIGSTEVTVTNTDSNLSIVSTLEVPAQLINSRTMVPLRFISESFGSNVTWDGSSYTVNIQWDSSTVPTKEDFDKFIRALNALLDNHAKKHQEAWNLTDMFAKKLISESDYRSKYEAILNDLQSAISAFENGSVPNNPFTKQMHRDHVAYFKKGLTLLTVLGRVARPDGTVDPSAAREFERILHELGTERKALDEKYKLLKAK